jgi:ribosome maturation factor RimP
MAQQSERLAAILEPVVRALGLDLYDVEVGGTNRARTLRVLIDREGGVDLEAITSATDALAPLLDENPDVAALLPGSYLLEVSSPGLERPLRTPAHFRRALGDTVSVKSRDADGAVVRRRALLAAADDDGIEIEIDGARERVQYQDIVASHTVFEWGPTPKPGKSANARKKKAKQTKTTVPAQG